MINKTYLTNQCDTGHVKVPQDRPVLAFQKRLYQETIGFENILVFMYHTAQGTTDYREATLTFSSYSIVTVPNI